LKTEFFDLAEQLRRELHTDEGLLCFFSGERSDFVRFNRALVRQAGSVEQRYVTLRLIHGRRQASATVSLAGGSDDLTACRRAMHSVRETLLQLPDDPWLLYSEVPHSTATERRGRLPPAEHVIGEVTAAAKGLDFVGFYAGGTVFRGFANSLGQHNWHEVDAYNFDWSLHLDGDKAVKNGYAGLDWDPAVFEMKVADSARELQRMQEPPRTLGPGEYRAYLAPAAVEEITGLLSYRAFSMRARATHQSALTRMDEGERLSPQITIVENTQGGFSPAFQEDGYVKPGAVVLIDRGAPAESLVSPRSAREYGVAPNGASAHETPESLELNGGDLPDEHVLSALDTGLYVGNLWYLNFSDKPAGRMTGMTRFATFWVERGRIVAPVNPLRFDDTVYRMFGRKLERLTRSRELLLSTSTYDERSTASARLPGALLESLRFTL